MASHEQFLDDYEISHLAITIFMVGSHLSPGGPARVVFLYLVLCIFVVIMCYKILLQYLL